MDDKRYCSYCGCELLDGDTVCSNCHKPYVPELWERQEGLVFVSKKSMSDVTKLAIIYGIWFGLSFLFWLFIGVVTFSAMTPFITY